MTNRSNKTSGGRSSSSPSKGSQVSPQSSEDRKDLSGSQAETCPTDMTSISNDDEEEEE